MSESQESPNSIVFEALLQQAALVCFAALKACFVEIHSDRGPSHILAVTYISRLSKAIADVEGVLRVKSMFKTVGSPDLVACNKLRDIVRCATVSCEMVAEHASKKLTNSSRTENGLASELGEIKLNYLLNLVQRCSVWTATYYRK